MRAELLLATINDETISPDDVKVLCINSEGKLLTMVISKSLYTKWSSNVQEACIQNKGYCALVDFTFTGEVSHSHIVIITEEEARVLDNIVNLAVNHPESLTEDGKIPEDMRWAPSQIIDNVIQYVEANKDNFLNEERSISSAIDRDELLDLERKGVFIEDKKEGSLALCMWEMGVQLKGRNSYVILIFTEDCTFQLNVVEIESVVKDAKAAVCKLFGLSNPIELLVEIPQPSLKEMLSELNPARLLNSKHISWRATVPSKNDGKICLCMEPTGEFLQVGLILETTKPATARLKKTSEEIVNITNFISNVCKSYLCNINFSKDYMSFLSSLLNVAKNENFGIATGEGLHKL